MRGRPGLAAGVLAALLLGAAGVPPAARADVPPEVEENLRDGLAKLEEFDYPGAVAALASVVRSFQLGELDANDPAAKEVLVAALVGRAAAHFGSGDAEAASGDLELLLSADPAYELDPEQHSPRFVNLLEKVRRDTIGYLSVTTDPAGCTMWIDGEVVGETPLEMPWIAGPVALRLERPGYAAITLEAELSSGEMLVLEKKLSASGREVRFLTSPPGVEIIVGGKVWATTAGTAPPEIAERYGFAPEALSAVTSAGFLPSGKNHVVLRRPCYKPESVDVDVVVDPQNARPLLVPPVSLERFIATLRVRSSPSGAQVEIDGEEVGHTPLDLDEVCAGEHRVELTGQPRGTWMGNLTLENEEVRELDVALRPTIMYIGVATGSGGTQAAREAADQAILEELGRLHAYLPLRVQAGQERTAVLLDPATDVEGRARIAEVLALLDGDMVIVAQVNAGGPAGGVELLLYSIHQETPERVTASSDDLAPLREFLASLGRPSDPWAPWLGLLAVDTRGEPHPVVVELLPGPAGPAGVRVGDRIVSLGEAPVASAADLERLLDEAVPGPLGPEPPDRRLALGLSRGGEPISVELEVGSTPFLPTPGEPGRSYNKLLVDLEYAARGSEGSELGPAVARLARAVAFTHFDRCDLAVETMGAGVQLPQGPGISAGTAAYLRGLCHARMGPEFAEESRRELEAAAASADATLRRLDGPRVAPLARLHLDGPAR